MNAWVEKCASSSERGLRRHLWIAVRRRLAIAVPARVLALREAAVGNIAQWAKA